MTPRPELLLLRFTKESLKDAFLDNQKRKKMKENKCALLSFKMKKPVWGFLQDKKIRTNWNVAEIEPIHTKSCRRSIVLFHRKTLHANPVVSSCSQGLRILMAGGSFEQEETILASIEEIIDGWSWGEVRVRTYFALVLFCQAQKCLSLFVQRLCPKKRQALIENLMDKSRKLRKSKNSNIVILNLRKNLFI